MMMAVGDYSITRETWQGIPLTIMRRTCTSAADASCVFPDAPAMLKFRLHWSRVSRRNWHRPVVWDYVSGAMENTTAIVYGGIVQRTERETIHELQNESICATRYHASNGLVTS